ncbi:MAG TPA: HAD-IA family hydrolase [Actinomycetota bacterium]|nr:HAD-IA family hydrolase [Actinomycetota bacterium]
MPPYEAVLFDAGETLVRPEPSFGGLLHAILHDLGYVHTEDEVERCARPALMTALDRATAERRPWSVSPDSSIAFWSGVYTDMLGGLGIEDRDGALATRIYREFAQPHRYGLFPDALPALRELKVRGYRLGVVSNWEDWLASLFERLGVASLFDAVVVSGSEGVEKPDPAIFAIALERMGVPPERSVYVGDSLTHDVAPALSLGMGAVLIDRHRRYDGVHRPTIESLGILSAVL